MKILFFNLALLLSLSAIAQPINYQGRLKEKSGSNVNGTRNFTLRIFDAKTGGKQVYEENVGAVTVNEGAYSFNFGENGKSVSTATETIGFADGEKQIFNYTVKNTPVLGEIKISGGGYSWTESGSSDATKFTATANKNSGAVSAIFLTGAPEAGENVSISYDHNSNGVMGALSRGGQAWLEIAVGGETLSPRERLVAVPFALRAGVAGAIAKNKESVLLNVPEITFSAGAMKSGRGKHRVYFMSYKPEGAHVGHTGTAKVIELYVPENTAKLIIRIKDGKMNYYTNYLGNGGLIPGTPKLYAYIGNSGDDINATEAEFKRHNQNEFHLDNPKSGWKHITFMVDPLSDYSGEHHLYSYNKLVILLK